MITIYPQPESFIGKEVDGHRIDAVLGRGGMGIVFKAQNLELSRTVALKIINPALAQDESFLRRFRSEARALAQIHHPNIVIVYAFRQFDMGFYLSMEYVEGMTLAEHLEKHGSIPWNDALHLTKQMLSAFHYAHSCGVIHRDIKPRNILLTSKNVVKITDFGLAKILQEGKLSSDTTVTMATGGTIHYMPPEQIRGLKNVDHRGDIFSLGMTLYEAIAGDLPFDKNSSGYTIQKMIVEEPFPDIRKRAPDLPKAMARIVMKALEKDPNKRFQSAAEMISAIEEFEIQKRKTSLALNGSSSTSSHTTALIRRWKIYAGVVGILLIFGTLIGIFTPSFFTGDRADGRKQTLAEQLMNESLNPSVNTAEAATEGTASSRQEETNRPSRGTPDFLTETPALAGLLPGSDSTTSNSGRRGAAASGSIRIDSSPRGAEVKLNGRIFGITPLFIDEIEAGNVTVNLSLNNYEMYSTETDIEPLGIAQVFGELTPIQGVLLLDVNPPSALYIDGQLVDSEAGTDYHLPLLAMNHEVKLSHPDYGVWARDISIAPGDSSNLSIDFTQKVRLIVTAFDSEKNGMYAEIILNDESTDEYTPNRIEVPVGQHRIAVRADGYELLDEVKLNTYDTTSTDTLRFTLKKTEN